MSDVYLIALRAMHATLPSSLILILTFRHQLLNTIICKTNTNWRNFEVWKIAS